MWRHWTAVRGLAASNEAGGAFQPRAAQQSNAQNEPTVQFSIAMVYSAGIYRRHACRSCVASRCTARMSASRNVEMQNEPKLALFIRKTRFINELRIRNALVRDDLLEHAVAR